jgi:transcriptional regulator with XRE-family HTH domain
MPDRDNGNEDPGIFALVLKAEREHAGHTQREFADLLGYAESTITAFERGKRLPTPAGAERIDKLLRRKLFVPLREQVIRGAYRPWFQPWLPDEEGASVLRVSEPQVVYGLMQTPDYAEALAHIERPLLSDAQVAEVVAARMLRQEILDREDPPPPLLRVVQGEASLRRDIGGKDVMRGQLDHLLEMADKPRVALQVVTAAREKQSGLFGAITIASVNGSPDTAYLDTVITGGYITDGEQITQLNVHYDRVLQEASTPEESKKLIMEVRDELWT